MTLFYFENLLDHRLLERLNYLNIIFRGTWQEWRRWHDQEACGLRAEMWSFLLLKEYIISTADPIVANPINFFNTQGTVTVPQMTEFFYLIRRSGNYMTAYGLWCEGEKENSEPSFHCSISPSSKQSTCCTVDSTIMAPQLLDLWHTVRLWKQSMLTCLNFCPGFPVNVKQNYENFQ
jgi:hypothetical protein